MLFSYIKNEFTKLNTAPNYFDWRKINHGVKFKLINLLSFSVDLITSQVQVYTKQSNEAVM